MQVLTLVLLCSDYNDRRIVDCGDEPVMLTDRDARLFKSPTLAEFIAFSVFVDVICKVFSARRTELDTYLANISDSAMTQGGSLFSEH